MAAGAAEVTVVDEAPSVHIGLSKNKWLIAASNKCQGETELQIQLEATIGWCHPGCGFSSYLAFLWVVLVSGKDWACNGKIASSRARPAPSRPRGPTGKSTFIRIFSKCPRVHSTGGHLAYTLMTMTSGRVRFNWITWTKHMRNRPPLTPYPIETTREKGVGY